MEEIVTQTTNSTTNSHLQYATGLRDEDFEKLDNSLKNKAIIIIPGNGVSVLDASKLVYHAMKPYNDQIEVEPYVVSSLDDAIAEYHEDVDLYNDFDEFCLKNYGGYVDGQNIMSTINYDGMWSYYKIRNIHGKGSMFSDKLKESLNDVSFVIDQNYTRYDKDKSDGEWINKVSDMIINSIPSCHVAVLEYT